MDDPSPPDDTGNSEDAVVDAIEAYIEAAVAQILSHEDPARFFAWVRESAAEEEVGNNTVGVADPKRRLALVMAFGRGIWNATPLPSRGMKPQPLPAPKRNDECPCGSQAKFKKCCGESTADAAVPLLDSTAIDAIAYDLLSRDQRDSLRALDNGGADKQHAMLAIAELDAGNAGKAVETLEPMIARGATSTHPLYASAFGTLIRAYAQLERHAEIDALATSVAKLPKSSLLRAAGRVQLAEILILQGQPERARAMIEAAKRDDYYAPRLPVNEVLAIRAAGLDDKAIACAEAWIDELLDDEAGEDRSDEINILEDLIEEIQEPDPVEPDPNHKLRLVDPDGPQPQPPELDIDR